MEFYRMLVQNNSIQSVFQQIKNNGPISRREIQANTGLSWGTVSRAVEHLITQEYVIVLEKKDSKGVGPKTEKLNTNPEKHYFIGLDLDNRRLIAMVTDVKGCEIEVIKRKWTIFSREHVMSVIFEIVDYYMDKYQENGIEGIGFALQGVADVRGGISNYIGKIDGWNDVPLKQILEERYSVNVVVSHDPDCLMKCEIAMGLLKERSVQDVLLIHYGYEYALGMSVVMNGQIYIGHHGRAGEIGYSILDINEDGSSKLLEQYVQHRDDKIPEEMLCDYIARGVAMANSFFNPETIVLHIPDCPVQDMLVDSVHKRIANSSWDKTVEIAISELSHLAKAQGAALLSIENKIETMM